MNLHRSVTRLSLLMLLILTLSAGSFAQVFVSVRIGPPVLPVYAQPICPGPGFIWTPGYWAWNDDGGYYWVPGTWVLAPVGMLWTPGYWGWGGGFYMWHPGYWGPHVGFYGGINYGYGYGGVGFWGGEWRGGNFYYNRSVTNVSVTNVTNVYNKTVIVNNTTVNNVSYNGGTGGIQARPTPQEMAAEHEQHRAPLATQTQHMQLAAQNRQNFASVNHGKPVIAATARAADFSSRSVIAARAAGGEYHAPAMSPKEARGPAVPANRGFTPANANNANRTTGPSTATPQNRGGNSGGFRPFTPPNATNSGNANRGMSNSTSTQDKGGNSGGFRPFTPPNATNTNRSTSNPTSTPQEKRGNAGEFRPFNQPNATNPNNKGASNNPMYQDKGNSGSNPLYEPKGRETTPNQSNPHQSNPPQYNNRNTSRPAPEPRRESPPPPRKENAPNKDEHPRGR